MKKLLVLTMVLVSYVSYGQRIVKDQNTNYIKIAEENEPEETIVYVSVLRYKGKVISAQGLERDDKGGINRTMANYYHSFNRNVIDGEDLLELISSSDFKVKDNIVSRFFCMSCSERLPRFMSLKYETIKIK